MSLLPKTSVSSLPRITEITVKTKIAQVTVFNPPAVDPGEPPISIKITVKILLANVIPLVEILLKPAVLGVTDAKNELNNLSFMFISAIVCGFLCSKSNINKVPPNINIKVVIITILACKDNFFIPLKSYNSNNTVNPKPPIIINALITNITTVLFE